MSFASLDTPDLRRKSLSLQLLEILERQIVDGKLQPGTKLSEEGVAEAYSVSRSPAREALAELTRLGLAERSGPRDRVVATPTRQLISDTYEITWILGGGRVYLSSLLAPEEDHRRLYALLDEMEVTPENNRSRRMELSAEYHYLLTCRCDNTQLISKLQDCDRFVAWFKNLYRRDLDTDTESVGEHRQIVDYYVRKDLLGLISIVRAHTLRQRDQILQRWQRLTQAPGMR